MKKGKVMKAVSLRRSHLGLNPRIHEKLASNLLIYAVLFMD
jgi:hypothetical protein